MNAIRPSRRGFTLLELLIVITVIALLSAALYPVFVKVKSTSQVKLAIQTMSNITMAMTQYREDFGAYPPDDMPGSEMIANYLARVHKSGDMKLGTYLTAYDSQLTDSPAGNGRKRFLSPLGGEYAYAVQLDKNGRQFAYVLVDPGADKELGGKVDRNSGFVEGNSKQAADNITHEALVQKSP